MTPLRVGIVGTGNISSIYLANLGKFASTEVVAVADLDRERARGVAEKFGVPHALSTDELLVHPDVDLVLNLTIPAAHGDIAQRAIEAGKHVYNEKPLTIDLAQARSLVENADAKSLRVGCAPDTFLGAGQQSARRALDAGDIGHPILAHGFMMYSGPEKWHPSPEFFYKKGAGPLLDMGPYYLTSFINLFGAIKSVTAATRVTWAKREIGSEPLKGQMIEVETPTSLIAALEFHSGVIAQLTTSFDTVGHFPNITVFGDEASMEVPDPNTFHGDLVFRRNGELELRPCSGPFSANSRGIGLVDLVHAASENRASRASGELALHVLEAMLSIIESGESGQRIELQSRPDRPTSISDEEFIHERTVMDHLDLK